MWHSRTPGAAWRERRDAGGELTAKGVALIRHEVMDQDGNGVWTTPGGDQVARFAGPDGNILPRTHSPAASATPG